MAVLYMTWKSGPEFSENSKNSENSEIPNKTRNPGKFARSKGQRGELEIKKVFILVMEQVQHKLVWELGENRKLSEAIKRNTLQSDRGGFDIINVPLLAPEVKYVEAKAINTWWKQTCNQAPKDKFPVLFYRCNHYPWMVRSYVSLQFPGQSPVFNWIVADYTLPEFMRWYDAVYSELLRREAGTTTTTLHY